MFRLLSLAAGGSLTNVWGLSQCASPFANEELAREQIVSPNPYHVKSSYGKDKEGFYIMYDTKTRNPLYVVEKLSRNDGIENNDNKKSGKRPPFSPEYLIADDQFRVHPKDYNDSTYDRGHMIPAADFLKDSTLYDKTFTMANISPQAPQLNQGFWSRFESWIRHFLLRYIFDEAIIITGPVFAPIFIDHKWVFVNRTVGTFPNLIHVPTHFFKVILGKKKDSDLSVVAAFMVPNIDTVSKTDSVMNYMVKLSQLESLGKRNELWANIKMHSHDYAIVGFRFFPSLIDEKERDKLDAIVPESRDLVQLLNSNNMLDSNLKRLSAWNDIGNPKNTLNIAGNGSQNVTALKKKNLSTGVIHLCESGVDCSKCMFKPN